MPNANICKSSAITQIENLQFCQIPEIACTFICNFVAVGNPGPDLGLPWELVSIGAALVPVSRFGEDRML